MKQLRFVLIVAIVMGLLVSCAPAASTGGGTAPSP